MKRFIESIRTTPYRWAYRYFCRCLKKDAAFAQTWQSNIAMPIYDGAKGKLTHAEANRIADHLMFHLFEVRK